MSVVFGFIGGLAAVGFQAWLSFTHESRRTRASVRAACRLVDAELGGWHLWLRVVYQENFWWPAPASGSTTAWEQHRALLADQLSDEEWILISDSYSSIRDIEAHRDAALRDNRDWLEDVDLRCLRRALEVFDAATSLMSERGLRLRARLQLPFVNDEVVSQSRHLPVAF